MGCCISKDEEPFDGTEVLLPKTTKIAHGKIDGYESKVIKDPLHQTKHEKHVKYVESPTKTSLHSKLFDKNTREGHENEERYESLHEVQDNIKSQTVKATKATISPSNATKEKSPLHKTKHTPPASNDTNFTIQSQEDETYATNILSPSSPFDTASSIFTTNTFEQQSSPTEFTENNINTSKKSIQSKTSSVSVSSSTSGVQDTGNDDENDAEEENANERQSRSHISSGPSSRSPTPPSKKSKKKKKRRNN